MRVVKDKSGGRGIMSRTPRSRTLETFGRLVRVYRDAAGITQKELAKTLDYTNGWVSNVETGQLRPRAEQVWLLEQVLNLLSGALMAVYEQLDSESLPGWMHDWVPEEGRAVVLWWVVLFVFFGLFFSVVFVCFFFF